MLALARLVAGPLVGLGLVVGALAQAPAAGAAPGGPTWPRLSGLHAELVVTNGGSGTAGASTIAIQDALTFAILQAFALAGLAAGANAIRRPRLPSRYDSHERAA
jgi:hypothetical protein